MVEILICSLLTILPDYLYRRYGQGKRFGHEITLYSVWFELRWGIIGCLMLTVSLITVIFYNHPSTTNATLFFRTVPIVPESGGVTTVLSSMTKNTFIPPSSSIHLCSAASRKTTWSHPRLAASFWARRLAA